MNNRLTLISIILIVGLFGHFNHANAAPSNALIAQYNQAAASGDIDAVLQQLEQLKQQEANDPLTLVYWGSATAISAAEQFWPWSKYETAEAGLQAIDKSLSLLDAATDHTQITLRRLGLDQRCLTQAVAAITYTAVPKMFNRFERGYDLFITLLDSPQFQAVLAQYTGWIYQRAIAAAVRSGDTARAEKWQQQLTASPRAATSTIVR